MTLYEVQDSSPQLVAALVDIWDRSVRATHLFLSDEEVEQIKKYVPQALDGVQHLIVAEDESGEPVAFMGTENGRLEKVLASGCCNTVSRIMTSGNLPSTSRIPKQLDFTNTWGSEPTGERTATSKAIPIRFCT